MLKVGITGGIGSGKSTVSGIFGLLGIPVYNSDLRARVLMTEDADVVSAVKSSFGEDSYLSDGSLDRARLAGIVFADPAKLAQLNSIVHPAVGRDFVTWCSHQSGQPYVIKEAALIFEAGINRELDFVITVYAPEEVRVGRVTKRDKSTVAEVKARMANQWSDDKKALMSDFIITNYDDRPLLRQVMEVHKLLLSYGEDTGK